MAISVIITSPNVTTNSLFSFLRNIMFEGQGASASAKFVEAFRPQKTIGLEEPMSREERAEALKEVLKKYTSEEKTEFIEEVRTSKNSGRGMELGRRQSSWKR